MRRNFWLFWIHDGVRASYNFSSKDQQTDNLSALFAVLLGHGCSASGHGFSHQFYHFNTEKDGLSLAFLFFQKKSIFSVGIQIIFNSNNCISHLLSTCVSWHLLSRVDFKEESTHSFFIFSYVEEFSHMEGAISLSLLPRFHLALYCSSLRDHLPGE